MAGPRCVTMAFRFSAHVGRRLRPLRATGWSLSSSGLHDRHSGAPRRRTDLDRLCAHGERVCATPSPSRAYGIIDLFAALPSLIYGIWGLEALSTQVYGTTNWLGAHASFIPFFVIDGPVGNSIFLCGLVVGVMCIPIVTSISREVMSQVPREACEAALALGGTSGG